MAMTPYLNFLAAALPTLERYDNFRTALSKTDKKEEVVVLINALSKTHFEHLQKITEESVWSEEFKHLFTVDTLMSCFYEDEHHNSLDFEYILYNFLKQRKYSRSCLLILNIIDSWKKPDYNPVESSIISLCFRARSDLKLIKTLLHNCHLFTSTPYRNYFLYFLYDTLTTIEKGRSHLLKQFVRETNDRSKLLFMLVLRYHNAADLRNAKHYINKMPETTEEEIGRKKDLERLLKSPPPKKKTPDICRLCQYSICTFRLSDTFQIILSSD